MTDPVYIAARRVLLDALEALGPHRKSVVLCGAQAIYLHVGEGDLSVAPYTTDGDIAIDPAALAGDPLIDEAMTKAGFLASPSHIGTWFSQESMDGEKPVVKVDLLVPELVSGGGRRSARIPPHGERTARKARGLEGVLVDRRSMSIDALDPTDNRSLEVMVAGPAALTVAKMHKLLDRVESPTRLEDKDALDVYRLLRGVKTAQLAEGLRMLEADERTSSVTEEAIQAIREMLSAPTSPGVMMARRAAGPLEDGAVFAASFAALAGDLLNAL